MAADAVVLSSIDERGLLAMTANPSNGALQQLINDHKEDADKAHARLRDDLNGIGRKADSVQIAQTDILLRLQRLELIPPVNIDKMSWTTKQMVAFGFVVFGLGGGLVTLQLSINDVQKAITAAASLQNQRNESQEQQLKDVKAELQLRRIEIQNLSNKLSDFMLQKGK